MMSANFLQNYETVDERIHKFHATYSEGRILTELIAYSDTQFIVKAMAYVGDVLRATGLAEERVGSSHINKTSALENCETSAIGRCLANLGLSAKGNRPSDIEMSKADRQNDFDPQNYKPVSNDNNITEKQASFVKSILEDAFISSGMRDHEDRLSFVTKWLGSPRKIAGVQHLTKMEAIKIINDKTSNKGDLIKSLRANHGPDYDPWETPNKG
jgi:hypothetical protein